MSDTGRRRTAVCTNPNGHLRFEDRICVDCGHDDRVEMAYEAQTCPHKNVVRDKPSGDPKGYLYCEDCHLTSLDAGGPTGRATPRKKPTP